MDEAVPPRTYVCLNAFERAIRPLICLVVLVVYTYLGAYIFHLLEEPHELQQRKLAGNELHRLRRNFTDEIRLLYNDLQDTSRLYPLETLLRQYQLKIDQVHTQFGSHSHNATDWDVWGAATYSVGLYATIGYTSAVSRTGRGQLMSVVYALVGIPLLLATLYDLGRLVASLILKVYMRFGRRRGPHHALDQCPLHRLLYLPVMTLLPVAFIVYPLLSALVLHFLDEEHLDYWQSLYTVMETIMTIGLGNQLPHHTYLVWRHKNVLLLYGLVLVFFVLLAAILHLIAVKVHAVYRVGGAFLVLEHGIDMQYAAAQASGQSPLEGCTADGCVEQLLLQLPRGARVYSWLLSNDRRNRLRARMVARAGCVLAACQTDDYLLRAGNVQLSTIVDSGEDTRSHDDVNSLVAMCDWSI